MAIQNVKFYFGLQKKYDELLEKNPLALYFIEDTQRLYKGDVLLATGADATSMSSGLMSKEDKIKLDSIVANYRPGFDLTPVDDTIVIVNKDDGSKSIGVAVSKTEGNLIAVKEDGLFVKVDPVLLKDVVGLADRLEAIEKAAVGGIHYRGSVETEADLPANAVQGDLYEVLEDNSEWCFNGEKWFKYGNTKGFTPVAGDGISIVDSTISVKIAHESHGLVAVDDGLYLPLATKNNDGAMSKEDKAFITSIPEVYVAKKYEISSKPEGTLVSYKENEIRVMVPADTKWVKQSVGSTGNSNMYYMGFKAYAPAGAASFKEGDRGVIIDEMFDFNGDFAGTDDHGRNYSICWLALASYDAKSDSWTYFGKNSSAEKYIGWDYVVEWYDANGIVIESDSIRINLSNEDCHNVTVPYYMNGYATVEHVAEATSKIDDLQEMYSWGEL